MKLLDPHRPQPSTSSLFAAGPDLPLMLPDREITSLLLLVVRATGFADEGKLADGYALLLTGHKRAEDLRDGGESWGIELVLRYQRALDSYIAFYGVAME